MAKVEWGVKGIEWAIAHLEVFEVVLTLRIIFVSNDIDSWSGLRADDIVDDSIL